MIVNFICSQIVAHFYIAKMGHLRCYLSKLSNRRIKRQSYPSTADPGRPSNHQRSSAIPVRVVHHGGADLDTNTASTRSVSARTSTPTPRAHAQPRPVPLVRLTCPRVAQRLRHLEEPRILTPAPWYTYRARGVAQRLRHRQLTLNLVRHPDLDLDGVVWSWAGPCTWTPPCADKECPG